MDFSLGWEPPKKKKFKICSAFKFYEDYDCLIFPSHFRTFFFKNRDKEYKVRFNLPDLFFTLSGITLYVYEYIEPIKYGNKVGVFKNPNVNEFGRCCLLNNSSIFELQIDAFFQESFDLDNGFTKMDMDNISFYSQGWMSYEFLFGDGFIPSKIGLA